MPYIWHISVIQFTDITTVSGTLLNSPVSSKVKTLNSISNALMNSRTYFEKPYGEKMILIKLGKLSKEVKTDSYGGFSVNFKGIVHGEVFLYTNDFKLISGTQAYPVFFTDQDIDTLVISDIDDTILQSFTRTKIKRLLTTLFRPYHKRKLVDATNKLYTTLSKSKASFYYVSKSESNLFGLISNFIIHNNLPVGPLILTPYLRYSQLVKDKKDPLFKFLSICHILDHAPSKPVILIGDDTQADMDVFTKVIEKYGAQIDKVYIHQTSLKTSKKQKSLWTKLENTGTDVMYFKHDDLF